jgi:2-oxoisovalerate dehydrogenase E1 component
MLRTCTAAARVDGTVSVFLEPIARYHDPDLHEPGDGGWTAPYDPPPRWPVAHVPIGHARCDGTGRDLLLVSWANGAHLAARAVRRLAEEGISASVLDLRWLAPLPVDDLVVAADRVRAVLVVDETRHAGGVGEAVLAALVERGVRTPAARVAAADSLVPLGPAAAHVMLSLDEVVARGLELVRSG